MKQLGISLLVISTLILSCSRKPKDLKGQSSYAIGASFGKSLKAQNLDLDVAALTRGVADALNGKPTALTDEEMQKALADLSEARQKEMAAVGEKNKIKADEFMTKNRQTAGIQVTKTGLQYKMTAEGTGPSPKFDDIVVVQYKGTLIDGTEFDSSYKRNMPAEFPVKGVIPGWTEGLQLMKKGGKATFYIPPELAYGGQSRNQIPSNAVLIFDVELVDVKAAPAQPKSKKL